ncbi:MAG: 50S ribosomal protein L17 [Victivallales bacterium]|nr:50S ribosomal protein L17 [Victivallales bacterium]
MRHHVHTFKVGRTTAHRKSMLSNAVNSLLQHGRITTTLVKAKEIRRFADKMITLGKKDTLHARQLAIAYLKQHDTVKSLFQEVAPSYKERQGGYTRIMKLGPRRGDAAEMCILELVETDDVVAATKKAAAEAAEAPKAEETAEAPKAEETAEAPKA